MRKLCLRWYEANGGLFTLHSFASPNVRGRLGGGDVAFNFKHIFLPTILFICSPGIHPPSAPNRLNIYPSPG